VINALAQYQVGLAIEKLRFQPGRGPIYSRLGDLTRHDATLSLVTKDTVQQTTFLLRISEPSNDASEQ